MVVQRDVVDNATVANVLHVLHMAELLHWVKISPKLPRNEFMYSVFGVMSRLVTSALAVVF